MMLRVYLASGQVVEQDVLSYVVSQNPATGGVYRLDWTSAHGAADALCAVRYSDIVAVAVSLGPGDPPGGFPGANMSRTPRSTLETP
jgi:hypothetical protein